MRAARLFLAALALAAAASARAESPRRGSFELGAGNYTPDIDADFAGEGPGPYEEIFGNGRGAMFRFALSRALFTRYGSLEVGFQTGYFTRDGRALTQDGQRSGDETGLHVIPTSVALTYRFDVLAQHYPVPLAPYARATLERYNWWISNSIETFRKKGATNGYSVTGGVAILLDFFDRGLARELDSDTGINDTYLYVDVTKSFVSDFGSDESWDLSGKELMFSGGLLFAF